MMTATQYLSRAQALRAANPNSRAAALYEQLAKLRPQTELDDLADAYRERLTGGEAEDADFEESKHPRVQGGEKAGQFAPKGGGGGGAAPASQETNFKAFQRLTKEYQNWQKAQGLKLGSAEEHIGDPDLTKEQRAWLADFSQRWEKMYRESQETVKRPEKPEPKPRSTRERLEKTIDDVAKELDYDRANISWAKGEKKFKLGGKEYNYAGAAYLQTGKIELWENQLHEGSVGGVTAHEIEHQKYQAYENAREAERAQLMKELEPYATLPHREHPMKPDGSLREGWAERFPLYQKHHELTELNNAWMKLKTSDGVTEYSRNWWKEAEAGNAQFSSAFHETLAEMARVKHQGGQLPGAPVWKALFKAVDEHWAKARKPAEYRKPEQLQLLSGRERT